MSSQPEDQLVADVALGLVGEFAPQDRPIFRANCEAYFKDPGKALTQGGGQDQMLGFGVAEATSFLTPMALAVAGEVVTFLVAELKKSLAKEGSGVVEEGVRSLFKRFRPPEKKAPVTLTAEQLKEVHRIAIAKAHALKLSDARAQQLADALVSELAI